MIGNVSFDGGSSFRIKRSPLITTSGSASDVDTTVKSHLAELSALFGKRVFSREECEDEYDVRAEAKDNGREKGKEKAGEPRKRSHTRIVPPVKQLLERPLTPRHVPPAAGGRWAEGSVAHEFAKLAEAPEKLTLSEYIDLTPQLSALKYEFESNLSANWPNLDYNTKAVLSGYPALREYLIAYAFHVQGLHEVNGLKNFILSNRAGAKNVVNYAIVSAARTIIDKEHLEVDHYNEDHSAIVEQIRGAGLSLSSASFGPALRALVDDFVFNSLESKLIDEAGIGALPAGIKPQLVQFIKNSPVPITRDNVKFFLPNFVLQLRQVAPIAGLPEATPEEADKDFDVQLFEDDSTSIQISRSAVKCAAQLYYSMILGDELDVFNVVNWFTHKYLIRGGVEISDSHLRDDLQLYVFSAKFTDLKTKKLVDRTRPAERQMFYRQVFNYGRAPISEDIVVNQEFPRLWKVLMLESAKYLERAQASPHPDNFVSRQNVMQAVEDLQYNLSTHSTGMANVVSPLVHAELNFVIQRIFMHPEIIRQVVPTGGTWWRVVEALFLNIKNVRPRSTVLYNKAKLGHSILRQIANYNPSSFEDDASFAAFISDIDAFITTQSILQEALTDELKRGDSESAGEDEDDGTSYAGNGAYTAGSAIAGHGMNGGGYTNGAPRANGHGEPAPLPAGGASEWDF